MIDKIKLYWQNEKKNILFCFAATFILGLAAHAYVILNNDMSHDWLNAFVATDIEEDWKIRLGRYIVPLYRAVFRNSIALPWLIGIMSLFWYSLSVYLLTKIFEVRSRLITVLISGIAVTNITVIAQFATYLYEADFNALALFLAVASAYIWKKHRKIYTLILSAVLLFISMGIYQSYVCVTITLMICVSILDLFDDKDIKYVIKRGLLGIAVILAGFVLYHFIGQLIYSVTGLEPEGRVNALALFSSDENIFKIIFETFLFFIRNIFHVAYNRQLLIVFFALTAVAMLYLVICVFIKNKLHFSKIALIITLLVLLPIGMCAIYIITCGSGIHDLMIYAVWISWIMIAVLASRFSVAVPSFSLRNISRGVIYASVAVIIWQNVVIANTAYIKKDLVAQSTFSTMTRVLDRIEQHPDYIHGQTPVLFVGFPGNDLFINPYDNISDFTDVNLITGVGTNSAITLDSVLDIYDTYTAYLKYILNSPIIICDANTNHAMRKNEVVIKMPVYPSKDSIQMIDGVLVVKMGK